MSKHCIKTKENTNKAGTANTLCTLIFPEPAAASTAQPGKKEQLPGRAGWRAILVGWAASTAPSRRNQALTLSGGSVCSLQGWRGSTQGRKCLSEAREHMKWKNSAEDSAVRNNVFLAEGGAIQRWKVKFHHFMQQLLPSLLIQASCTVIFVQTCAGSSWLLAAHQCTKYNRHD